MSRCARIRPKGQYELWPDEDGLIVLPQRLRGQSSGLLLQPLPRLRPSEKSRALRALQLQSLSSWLLSKSLGALGFGVVRKQLFETWLSERLDGEAFGAMLLREVISDGEKELQLERETVIRFLVAMTASGKRFRSDGVIVTLRD